MNLKGLLAVSLRFEPVQLEKNDHTGFGGITFEMMVPNSVPERFSIQKSKTSFQQACGPSAL